MPAFLIAGFLLFALSGAPDWLRGATYAFGFVATGFGAYACYRIASHSGEWGWSLFLYTLFVREVAFIPICVVLFNTVTDTFNPPEWLPFALLVPSFLALSAANGVLFISLIANVLEARTDPIPFRSLFRRKR